MHRVIASNKNANNNVSTLARKSSSGCVIKLQPVHLVWELVGCSLSPLVSIDSLMLKVNHGLAYIKNAAVNDYFLLMLLRSFPFLTACLCTSGLV